MNISTLPVASVSDLLTLFHGTNEVAAHRVNALGLPTNKTEQYRFFGIKPLLAQEYTFIQADTKEIEEAEYIEIVDGVVLKAPKSVHVAYKNARLYNENNFDVLYHLSHVAAKKVIDITFSEETTSPLRVVHKVSSGLCIYRVAFHVKANVSVSVSEEIELNADAFALYGYDMQLEEYASLDFIRTQTLDTPCKLLASHNIDLKRNTNLSLKSYDFGEGNGLHLYTINLDEYATLQTAHLVYLGVDAKEGNVLHVNHIGKYSKSTQEAKYILGGGATGIFDGKIMVGEDAQYTSARQNSKAMILSRESGVKMVAKPQLEIYTDELEASHGSSTGQLDEKELFYLRSRGIKESDAKKMLLLAFANELIEKVKDVQIQQKIKKAFERVHKG